MRRPLRFGANVLVAVIVVTASLTVLGAVLGLPMGVVYVETESMSPTIATGEGFVLVPSALAGPPETGDVIVFDAQELRGGGPTTHRIIKKTERGYITQGDNNNVPDQVTGEPPVKRAQIAGQALEVRGHVVTIPYTGAVATTSSHITTDARQRVNVLLWRLTDTSGLTATQFSYVLTGALLMLYGVESFRAGSGDSKNTVHGVQSDGGHDEVPVSAHTLLLIFTLMIIVATTAAMVVPGGAHQYDVVASETESPVLVPPGEKAPITHEVSNSPVVPMVIFVESGDGVHVDRHDIFFHRGDTVNVSAVLDVSNTIGHQRFYIVEHRYLAVLPTSIIKLLYTQHPWLPIVIIDLLVAMPYYLLGRTFLPTQPSTTALPHL